MNGPDRLGKRLAAAQAEGSSLLVIYLTLGDPLVTSGWDLARAAVRAGADVLELGIPTRSTSPRGATIASSFRRAESCSPQRAFEMMRELRAVLPEVPLMPLIYPETIADLGRDRLISQAMTSADALVLVAPSDAGEVTDVISAGLTAIPVIRGSGAGPEQALEAAADRLTYRTMAPVTGTKLNPAEVARLAAELKAGAAKPFLAGFGISGEDEIRAISRHAAGVVIGSELHRLLAESAEQDRIAVTQATIAAWKAATRRGAAQRIAEDVH